MTEYNQYFQSSDYQHSRPPKPKFPWFRIIIIALIAGIIGALIVLGVNRLMNGDDSNSGGSQVQQATNDKGGNVLDGNSDKYKSVNAMIKDVSPAIVGVINMQKVTSFDDLLQGKSTKAQEAGIGSGVRRIEAITGRAALEAAKQDRLTIERMASELKTKAPQIEERLHQVLTEAKDTAKELEQIRKEVSAAGAADIVAGKVVIGDVEFVAAAVKASSIDELRDLADMGLDKLNGSGVVLVGAAMGDDKVNFVCKVSKDVVAKGAKAGNIVKAAAQVAGGNGGGRPDMAQAGGKEPAKLMEALKAGGEALKSMLQ